MSFFYKLQQKTSRLANFVIFYGKAWINLAQNILFLKSFFLSRFLIWKNDGTSLFFDDAIALEIFQFIFGFGPKKFTGRKTNKRIFVGVESRASKILQEK